MSWTLQHSTTTQPLAAWGLSNVTLTQQSLSPSILSAEVAGDILATLPWAFQDKVTLRDPAGVVRFVGYAMPPTRTGDAASETVQVSFIDAWWFLMRGVYTQAAWDAEQAAAVASSMVALFANVTAGTGWTRRDIAAELTAIVAACNAEFGGSVMQLGTLSGAAFDNEPIPERSNGVSYEQAIRAALKYVPDAVQRWDYTTTPPTLTFVQRSAGTVRTVAIADTDATPTLMRDDERVVRGVRIIYAVTDAEGVLNQIVDAAGETSGGGIVNAQIDLTGGSGGGLQPPTYSPEVRQEYTVESEAVDVTSAAWWFKYGNTGAQSAAQITVGVGSVLQAVGGGELGSKTRLWISGTIPESEQAAHVAEAEALGYLEITQAREAPDGLIWTTKERLWIRVLMTTTDLDGEEATVVKPGTVSGGGGSTWTPAVVPTGIAAALLASWGEPQWRGSFTLTKAECDFGISPGDVVNITGGAEEWEDMAAQVHQVTQDLDRGLMSVSIGAAEHMSAEDFLERVRVLRIGPALDLDTQAAGLPAGDNDAINHPPMIATPTQPRSSLVKSAVVWTFATGDFTLEMDAEAASMTHTREDGTARVTVSPAGTRIQNPTSEATAQTTPEQIELATADGHTATLTSSALTLEDPLGATVVINANAITFTKDGKTTTLSLLQLLHNDGFGKTMSVTEDQVIGTDASGSVVMDSAEGVRHTVDTNESVLTSDGITTTDGGDTTEMTPEGGVTVTDGTNTASLNANRLQLTGSGTTTVGKIAGATVELRDTDFCELEAGEPVTQQAPVLRGVPS